MDDEVDKDEGEGEGEDEDEEVNQAEEVEEVIDDRGLDFNVERRACPRGREAVELKQPWLQLVVEQHVDPEEAEAAGLRRGDSPAG